ncbi:MAG: hypothetical protein RIE77_12255 [Phycisphaerales bacterium]|jgi:hypothetical protein
MALTSMLAQIAGSDLDYTNQTSVHPVGLLVLGVLGVLVFTLPRRWSLAPLLVLACFVPAGQRIALLGLDFTFLRLLVIAYWVRILAFRDYKGLRLVALDYAVGAWILIVSLVFVLQWAGVSAVINRAGYIYESLGIYVTFRCLLRSWADVERTIVILSLVALSCAGFFMIEKQTGYNMFSVMGGVRTYTQVREGRLRAQGAFSHPIMAGCFFAIVLVLASGLFMNRRKRATAMAGCIASATIVIMCASSTPLLAVLSGGVGMAFAWIREVLRPFRYALVVMLVMLHFVMEGPVWALIARVSAVGGSTAWHRKHLIDKTVENFGEWAILGTRTTEHWGYGLQDVTNQYILEGVRGGVWGMAAFVVVIVLGFRAVGKALRSEPNRQGLFWLKWAVGASLFTHCMAFIGVSYFGQTRVSWFLTLALAATISQLPSMKPRPRNPNGSQSSNDQRLARGRPRHQLQHERDDPRLLTHDPRGGERDQP